jgi:hypothetical protein
MKNDKDVILAAVQNYSSSLKFASHNMKNDKDVALNLV